MSTSSLGTHDALSEQQSATAPVQQGDTPAAPTPTRWGRIAKRSSIGLRVALGAATGLWLGDALVLLHSRGGASWKQWLTGVGSALFVAATTAAVLGSLLGPILVPVLERSASAVRAWWRALGTTEDERSRSLASLALTAVVLTSLWSVVTLRVVSIILFDVARVDTTEIALVLSHVAFAATIAFAWPLAHRAARLVVGSAARLRGLRWLLARTWRILTVAGVLVFGAVLTACIVYRNELAAVSWLALAPLILVVPGIVVARDVPRLRPPWGKRITRVGLAAFGLAVLASAVAAFSLRPQSTTAEIIAFDRTLSGRAGYAAWVLALDFDRDGQINVLGGGDCAPFDARRHTGATDIPGNKIDEDCDGTDLSPTAYRPRPRSGLGQNKIASRPNVILITVDALGAPQLSALGSPAHLMPNVDRFAESSMLFSQAFSQGPSTRLSFPSMFTSRWDSQIVFSHSPRLPYSVGPKEKQVQDLIDDAGYDTVAIVANTYFEKSRWGSITRGFQQVDTSALMAGKHNAAQVTDAALRALSQQRDRPLYMWVHYFDAHPPYGALPGVRYPDQGDKDLGFYNAELTHIDTQMGRLLDAITQRGDATYVIVSADHSTVFHPNPESRKFHYGYDLYTATLHVPLVVHGPGITPGRDDNLVSTMDIAPTILDLLRLSQPPQFEGTSLTPELFAGQHDPRRVLFHEYYLPEFVLRGKDPLQIVSVRDEKWDLILNRDRGTYELYDWTADYYEQHDLYETMAFSQEAGHLRSMLGGFLLQFDNRPDAAALGPPAPPGEKEP
jgi:arylsulfatase A-like enzyme